ncbi:putative HAT dimerization domain, ribonuclease H-like superfamily [Helianthus annuus]|nr:putative HAT dimerization domain, ribonuclease H-like superfamily [Helianthus annuus]
MFASEQWMTSKRDEERKGARANDIVFTPTFWNNVLFTLKIMGPLVRVLRIVDNEKKPAMGYVYEGMERAKTAIAAALGGEDNEDYIVVSGIIDKRWNCQLHHPLHAAGYYLNPEFYCYNVDIESDKEVSLGLHECIDKLEPNKDTQDKINVELIHWVNQSGFFSLETAKRQHAEWWKLYGKGTPNLQQLAIRVLSLTCSSSGCERNWSTFEHIHSKKRNCLEHKKLHDLVYIKYNNMLKNRLDVDAAYDPISLTDIDDSNEWLVRKMGEDRVFTDDGDLVWDVVGEVSGAGERIHNTRSSQPAASQPSASRASVSRPSASRRSTSRPSSSRRLVDEDSEEEQEEEQVNAAAGKGKAIAVDDDSDYDDL